METSRRAVAEVLRLCRERECPTSEPLAMLVLLSIAMVKGKEDLELLDEASTTKLIEAAANRFSNANAPGLVSLQLQVKMHGEHAEHKDVLEEEAVENDKRRDELLHAVTKVKVAEYGSDVIGLYNKVLDYVEAHCSYNSLGSGSSAESQAESFSALESVFPLHRLSRFVTLSLEEKTVQLNELANIVLGIRIFNSQTGRGGNIVNAASMTMDEAKSLEGGIGQLKATCARHIEEYRSAIVSMGKELDPEAPALVKLQDEMRYYQTLEQVTSEISDASRTCTEIVYQLVETYEAEVRALVDVIEGSGEASVAKEKVYPLFDSLGSIHYVLVSEMRTLQMYLKLVDVLKASEAPSFQSTLPTTSTARSGESIAQEVSVATTAPAATTTTASKDDRADDSASASARAGGSDDDLFARVLRRHIIVDSETEGAAGDKTKTCVAVDALPDGVRLEFGGHCPYTYVEYGIVHKCDADVGFACYEDKYYGFLSSEGRTSFMKHPSFVIAAVRRIATKFPDVVFLLQQEASIPLLDVREAVRVSSFPMQCNFGTQTPTHFVSSHIDHNYEWNVWNLRRKAISLANLRRKQTRSAQSVLSHFRQEKETQKYLPREKEVQTKAVRSQHMARRMRYVQGMRGPPAIKMNIVDVQLELKQ